MILRVLLLMLTLLPFSSNLHADVFSSIKSWFGQNEGANQPLIKVLIAHNVQGIDLEVIGQYTVSDPFKPDNGVSTRFAGKKRYIQVLNDGLKWGEFFPAQYQVKISLDEPDSVAIIDGKEYIGNLYVYGFKEGTISIVNEVPVETYVHSILAKCGLTTGQPEALSALAIAARTNAYYQATNPKKETWSVEADKSGFEGRCEIENANLHRAIDLTRHMIMSRTGVYEGVATPFAAQFGPLKPARSPKEIEVAKISFNEADEMASRGEHAAQILYKAFPGTTIMLMR